jgi:hypothetical protein
VGDRAEIAHIPLVPGPVALVEKACPAPQVGEVLALVGVLGIDRDLGRGREQPHHQRAAVAGEVVDQDRHQRPISDQLRLADCGEGPGPADRRRGRGAEAIASVTRRGRRGRRRDPGALATKHAPDPVPSADQDRLQAPKRGSEPPARRLLELLQPVFELVERPALRLESAAHVLQGRPVPAAFLGHGDKLARQRGQLASPGGCRTHD